MGYVVVGSRAMRQRMGKLTSKAVQKLAKEGKKGMTGDGQAKGRSDEPIQAKQQCAGP